MKNKLISIVCGLSAGLIMNLLGSDGTVAMIIAICFTYVDLEIKRLKDGE